MRTATNPIIQPTMRFPHLVGDYPVSSDLGSTPRKQGTGGVTVADTDDLMEVLGHYSRRPTTLEDFLVVEDQEASFGATAPVSQREESNDNAISAVSSPRSLLDEVQAIVREFENLADGWDEPGSFAPTRDIVEDALVVLQNWQASRLIPEPEASVDGKIVLEIYDDEGFTLGGVELVGDHRAVYSVNWRTDVLGKGSFDTTSQSQIINALSGFKDLNEIERTNEPRG